MYLMLDELPSSLTLSLEGGIATHTLYMKGELTDGSLFGGVTFDLYDGDWTKIVPYGCTNTWDWSTWSMWDATSYQMEREISFDKAGIYYLYVSESLDVDGTDTWFRGHQIDITVE